MMGIRKGDFMNWKIHLCFMNMKRRKVRTVLTVLGAAIGVVSLVSLLAIGIGVKKELIGSMLASESVNKITITGAYGFHHRKDIGIQQCGGLLWLLRGICQYGVRQVCVLGLCNRNTGGEVRCP